jgi:hypothetical protein
MRLMRLWLLCFIIFNGGLCALENRNVASREQAPILRESEPFLAHIPVKNPHDRAVKVTLLDPTCSCATLEIAERFLLPGQITTLTIAVDNKNRSGPIRVGVSVYLSDPDLQPIEVEAWWQVRAAVNVDSIAPGMDPRVRPDDVSWHDIYRYVTKVRPDEPNRLHKRIRLSCVSEETPAGGLKVLGIDYPGIMWRFTPSQQDDGSWLITAKANNEDVDLPEGEHREKVNIRTNHPDKPLIELEFHTYVGKDAGEKVIDRQ